MNISVFLLFIRINVFVKNIKRNDLWSGGALWWYIYLELSGYFLDVKKEYIFHNRWRSIQEETGNALNLFNMYLRYRYKLEAIQKCQHFHECTNSTLFQTPPPPPKVYRPTFWGSKTRVSRSTNFIVQQQKVTRLRSLLCDKWCLWLCIMIYRLQLLWHTSTFNLDIFLMYTKKICSISQYEI